MKYTATEAVVALFLLVAAGVCEVSGGWLIWRWRREGGLWVWLALGSLVLVAYGVIATFQRQDFGRSYAAYGSFFVILALFWGWAVDGRKPDLYDWLGAIVSIVGTCLILFVPRRST